MALADRNRQGMKATDFQNGDRVQAGDYRGTVDWEAYPPDENFVSIRQDGYSESSGWKDDGNAFPVETVTLLRQAMQECPRCEREREIDENDYLCLECRYGILAE